MKEKFQPKRSPQTYRKRNKTLFLFVCLILFFFSFQSQSNARLNECLTHLSKADKQVNEKQVLQEFSRKTMNRPYKFPPLPKETEDQVAILVSQEPITDEFIEQLKNQFPELEIRHQFKHVFNGLSLKGKTDKLEEVEKFLNKRSMDLNMKSKNKITQNNGAQTQQLLNTCQLFPSYTYELEVNPINVKQLHKPNSINYIGTDAIRHIKDKNGNRLTGKGIKVGIIDTGIDYNHVDLRKAYVKGFDFIDQDQDPMETKGLGPLSTFHGTHVAGVIAANGKMTGIAPDAEIYVYRALGPGGIGTTETIITAIEQAMKDNVDVLNLSLGVSINGPDLPTSLALDKAVESGIVAVTSNGNAGPEIWTVGSPGTSERAISVGASTPELEIPYLQYDRQLFRLKPIVGSAPWNLTRSYDIIDGKHGKKEDLANLSVDGKIVLMKRGDITFTEKVMNAKNQGAIAVLIFNNEDIEITAQLETEIDIPAAILTKAEGERLLRLIKDKQTLAKIIQKKEEDLLADFSSRGPVTYTWDIKPDLLAPGVAIESTVPGGYLALQGTSMSAPHVAGAAALLKQANPDFSPAQIKALLMNTSILLQDEDSQTYKPFEQGAGRIDLVRAFHSNSIIQPASLKYGKISGSKFEEKTKLITVENISDEPVHYTFSTPPRSDAINWDLPMPFTLGPKQKTKIKIGLEVKDEHKQNQIFNGYLTMHANSQTIQIPYLYVVNEPNYPRIMAFSLETTKQTDVVKYEVYLPGGADEFGIALFEADTFQFVEFLDVVKNMKRGLVTKKAKLKRKIHSGVYIAVAFAKKEGKEDYVEQVVEINQPQ
jgi:minor extracellular serine protease Vpr